MEDNKKHSIKYTRVYGHMLRYHKYIFDTIPLNVFHRLKSVHKYF